MPTVMTRGGPRSITCVRLGGDLVHPARSPVGFYLLFGFDGRWHSNRFSGWVNRPRGKSISRRHLHELGPMGSGVALVWTIDGVVIQRH